MILKYFKQVMLMEDRFAKGIEYMLTRKFQIDPIERLFSQYRLMSGGWFLVSLREVTTTEKILGCRSILNDEDEESNEEDEVKALVESFEIEEEEIIEALLFENSREVAGGNVRTL